MKFLLTVLLCTLSTLTAQAAGLAEVKDDIVGAWRLDFTSPDNIHRTPIVVLGRHHDELAAWYIENGEPETFREVKLTGESLQLAIVPREHNDITVTLTANLCGDGQCCGNGQFKSTSGENGSWQFTGKRIELSEFNDVSEWNVTFTPPDNRQRTATVTVLSKDNQTFAWYSDQDYDLPARKVTVEGDEVSLAFESKTTDGAKLDVNFRGTVNGDQVKGNATYSTKGKSGQFSFTGNRKS